MNAPQCENSDGSNLSECVTVTVVLQKITVCVKSSMFKKPPRKSIIYIPSHLYFPTVLNVFLFVSLTIVVEKGIKDMSLKLFTVIVFKIRVKPISECLAVLRRA